MNSHENGEICHVQNIYITLINLYYLGNVAVLSLLFKLLQNDAEPMSNPKICLIHVCKSKTSSIPLLQCSKVKSQKDFSQD